MITYSDKLGMLCGDSTDNWAPYVKEPATIKYEYDTKLIYISDGTNWKAM